MKFEELKPNLLSLSPPEAVLHFSAYYLKRERDLVLPSPLAPVTKKEKAKKNKKSKGKKVTVSQQTLDALAELGLI